MPEKAYLQTEQGDRIDCLFNPSELTITKSAQWSPTKGPGTNTPRLLFQQGQSGTLVMNLTLDTTDSGDPVTQYTSALLDLMRVDPDLTDSDTNNNSARPPWCEFHWGDFHSFKAVVESLQIRFTYFAGDGTPLRAQAAVTLKQYEDEEAWGAQNPTSGTPHPHAVHSVVPGETLDRIAAQHYGDPNRWRVLAGANGILDPLELRPGTALVVPDLRGVPRG